MIRPKASFLPPGLSADEAAAMWHVRLESGALDDSAHAEFEAWHGESLANAAAYERACSVWSLFEDTEGNPHLGALRDSALELKSEPERGLWLGIGIGLAASLTAVLITQTDFVASNRFQSDAPRHASAAASILDHGEFATAKGERRTVRLADGTVVTLNTDSAIRLAYAPGRRLVRLLRGQVLFEVAMDHSRPFVVQAADRQVTALGTIFEVRLDPNRLKVVLVKGKVVVDGIPDRPGTGGPVIVPAVLMPGEELVSVLGEKPQLAKVDVDQQLRWREGFVEFDNVPLSSAVGEMNRYSSRRLVLQDAATGDLRLSGVFRTGNPERFAAIVSELLPIRSRALPNEHIELGLARPRGNSDMSPK